MIINKSIDIEEEIRTALAPYLAAYCRPLPERLRAPEYPHHAGRRDDIGNDRHLFRCA